MAAAPHHGVCPAVAPPGRIAKLPHCFHQSLDPHDRATDRHVEPGLFPPRRRLPVGLPGAHRRARVHPPDRAGPFSDAYMLNRESNVFPGILGRVCDRPCEPACRRGRVEDKPVAICRLKRVAADHEDDRRPPAGVPPAEERQARRLHRRRPRLAHGRERPAAARLRGRDLRAVGQAGRPDAHQHPGVPPARERARRGDRLHHSTWASSSATTRRSRACKKLLATGGFDAVFVGSGAPKGKELELPGREDGDRHPHRHRLARVGRVRAHREDRRARADHRRRQHGDGLLPQLAAPRREGRQGHGAQAARLLQGLGVGARGRRGRERRDRRQPLAEGVRDRGRQARRHDVRRDGVRARRARPHHRRARRRRGSSSRATT